jgi:hypothetical protein
MNDITNGKKLQEMLAGVIGVYALHRAGEIVYVGQAHCVRARIGQHMQDPDKDFDGYSFANLIPILERMNYPTGKKYLDWVEAWEINRAKPEQNRRTPDMAMVEAMMPRKLVEFCRTVAEREGTPIDSDFAALANKADMTNGDTLAFTGSLRALERGMRRAKL